MSDLPKLLYNIEEVESILDCKKTTVYRLLTNKKIIAKKFGKRTLVTAESLHAFIENLPEADINMAPPIANRFGVQNRERVRLEDDLSPAK